ncbi:MAG: hypothetical protein KDE27_32260 [Planctomycetes bacterium]|nr:hypothetical protein [Planctomycetota bacterium]
MTLFALATTALCFLPAPQGPGGLAAMVNDPNSHGAVGDTLLSLDEAIQVANGTLATTALSAAEQAQIAGAGNAVTDIIVNPAMVPTITLQAPLTDLVGPGAAAGGLTVHGMAMGGMQRTVIQAGSASHTFALREHHVTVMGFRVVGGQTAFDAVLPALSGPMTMARIMNCELDGQTGAGITLRASGTAETLVMTMRTRLTNMPVGFRIDDQSAGGRVMGECEFVEFDGVNLGCDVVENGSGNLSMWMIFRSTFVNGQTLARKRRGATSSQAFMFRFTHMTATCTGDVVDVEGGPNGLTMIHHHTSDWVAGAGMHAFWVHPRTALFDVHGSEMRFVGDVEVAGNPFTQRVWQQNNDYSNGTVSYDVDGALPNLLWNRYHNCSLVVPSSASSPVVVRQSEFTNTTVNGQSAFAGITLDDCYRSGGAVMGNSNETSPAPRVFLGTTTIAPLDPQIGSSIDLTADLPQGVGMIWIAGFAYARPTTTIEPVRFYGDPSTAVVFPGIAFYHTTTSVPIPSLTELVGLEFYFQGVSVPLPAYSWMPAYHLPRGELVRPRM